VSKDCNPTSDKKEKQNDEIGGAERSICQVLPRELRASGEDHSLKMLHVNPVAVM